MIKAVLFDYGGVLTESGKRGYITGAIAELYGLDPRTLNIGSIYYSLRRGGGSADAFFAELNHRFGKRVTKEAFLQKLRKSFVPAEDVYDLAKSLRQHGIKTGILSNIIAVNAAVLREQGWYDEFEPVVLSCEEGYAKPDLRIYEIALERVSVAPGEMLFVDDQERCLTPARHMGMKVIRSDTTKQIVDDIKKLLFEENKLILD